MMLFSRASTLSLLPLVLLFLMAKGGHALDNYEINLGDSFELKADIMEGTACVWIMPHNVQPGASEDEGKIIINMVTIHNNPGQNLTIQNPEFRPTNWKYKYIGAKDSKTECYVKVWSAIQEDGGTWELENSDPKREIRVLVFKKPKEPQGDPSNNYEFDIEQGEESADYRELFFYAKDASPLPTVRLFIGDMTVPLDQYTTESLNYTEENDNYRPESPALVTAKTIFNISATSDMDGKTLRVEVDHPAFGDNDTRTFEKNLTVFAPPSAKDYVIEGNEGGEVGSPMTLQLKFHSNPTPQSVQWFMHDLQGPLIVQDVSQRSLEENNAINISSTRYEFGNFTREDGHFYYTSLVITEVMDEDEGQSARVVVTNDRGNTTYTLEYVDIDVGLSTGAIVGIVLGVLAGVLVLGALGYVLMKKKKGKKGKHSTANPTRAIHPQPATRSSNITNQDPEASAGSGNPNPIPVEDD